jgi:hypothetical protein
MQLGTMFTSVYDASLKPEIIYFPRELAADRTNSLNGDATIREAALKHKC